MRTIAIETTRTGVPAIWERGGGLTTRGSATIVALTDGSKPRPVHIRRRGDLACQNHALVAIRPGHMVIAVSKGSDGWIARVDRIVAVDTQGKTASLDRVAVCDNGQWDTPPHTIATHLEAAVKAAVSKAYTYHCRWPVWVEERSREEIAAQEREDVRSRTARESGLGDRLSALVPRIDALRERNPSVLQITMEDTYFQVGGGWKQPYTEEFVSEQERLVEAHERTAHRLGS